MKIKSAPMTVGTYQYDHDSSTERGVPQYKKGDTYYKSNIEWNQWLHYMCSFCGDLSLVDVPRKATEEQKKDQKDAIDFIFTFSDFLEEEFLIKTINRAKSKRLLLLPYLIEEFKKTEGFAKFKEEYYANNG